MSEKSRAAAMLGRLGGKARAAKHSTVMLAEWAATGGLARAAKYTPEQLRTFAENAGRRPWKITPKVRERILAMLKQEREHAEIAKRFGVSVRSVGRLKADALARNREGD